MASTILSRFLPSAAGEPSIYETLNQHDEASDHSDLEERAGMALDEENLGSAFHDHELDEVLAGALPRLASTSRPGSANRKTGRDYAATSQSRGRLQGAQNAGVLDESDDEVPTSLLFEGNQEPYTDFRENQPRPLPPPVQGRPSREHRAKWKMTQERQRLYENPREQPSRSPRPVRQVRSMATADPREQALWRWANVQNLDNFLKEVYEYFLGNGIWCILLSRGLNLLYAFKKPFHMNYY